MQFAGFEAYKLTLEKFLINCGESGVVPGNGIDNVALVCESKGRGEGFTKDSGLNRIFDR